MEKLSVKYLRWGQQAGGAGWNKHVGKWLRRKANKRLRHFFHMQTVEDWQNGKKYDPVRKP